MAKRQGFIVGSTNSITAQKTDTELNNGWDRYDVLDAEDLDGVFNAVSDYSNDSSNEIANAIQSITGAQPTGENQSELASALNQMRQDIETSSLTFKGYISTTAPSSSTYALVAGNIWINSSSLPTSFPVAASSIKVWDGDSWENYGESYTPADFDFFRNINDNEGYYWFGGQWTVMSTDMSTTYFTLNQISGKWEIKQSVNLPGSPTTTTVSEPNDNSTKIATTEWTQNNTNIMRTNCITEIPQDIKLELSSGTLTLKAGSKVYVPNGSGVFDSVTISADRSNTITNDDTYMIFVEQDGSGILYRRLGSQTGSGTTTPTSGYAAYYNTNDNKVYKINNGVVSGQSSFPIAIVTVSGGAISSIDQVFNGFGYIGSTVFVLPGVKALLPNYRNTDGTLKNIAKTISSVGVWSYTYGAQTCYLGLANENNRPNAYGKTVTRYDPDKNITIDLYPTPNTYNSWGFVGEFTADSSNKITAFKVYNTFHAVDYSNLTKLLETIYPVGSIYIGTQSICPLEALIPNSSWTKIEGRYLLASGTLAGTSETYSATNTVASGAPNITGSFKAGRSTNSALSNILDTDGAFYSDGSTSGAYSTVAGDANSPAGDKVAHFDASRSNNTYGKSDAIRSPAYVVNVWRRTV